MQYLTHEPQVAGLLRGHKMQWMKAVVVSVAAMATVGCAAISEKEAVESYGSGKIVYFEVNNPNYSTGEAAIKMAEVDGANMCHDLGGDFCNSNIRGRMVLHNGNIKVTITKIFKLNVFVEPNISIKKGDIVKARFVSGGNSRSSIAHFIEVADPKDCLWDGSGVVCKSGWDYRKDLPKPML